MIDDITKKHLQKARVRGAPATIPGSAGLINGYDCEEITRNAARALSLKMGRNEFYIATLLKGGSRLRVDTLLELAEALETDPMALLWGETGGGGEIAVPQSHSNRKAAALLEQALTLLGPQDQNAPPKFEDVLSWWRDSGGQLVNCDHIIEHCDLHQAPAENSSRTMVRRIGSNSLATKILGESSIDRLHQEMDKAIPEESRRVTDAYVSAMGGSPIISCESLRGKLTSEDTLVLDYDRLLLPVVNERGERLILNYSKEVGSL